MRSRSCCAAVAAIALSGSVPALTARADAVAAYPTKPIRFIVPYALGAGTDTSARTIAAKLGQQWAQQVVVDNRTGGGGARKCRRGGCAGSRSPHPGYAGVTPTPKAPEVAQRLTADGSEIVGSTPEEFGAYMKTDIARCRKLIREAKLTL